MSGANALASIAPRPLSFVEVRDRYGLTLLRREPAMCVTAGVPRMTKFGAVSLGTPGFDGLFRFVRGWQLNAPTLNVLVESFRTAQARAAELDGELEAAIAEVSRDPIGASDAWYHVYDTLDAIKAGHDSYASAVVVVLSGLLSNFRSDADATQHEWEASGPRFGGCSAGQVIKAAGDQVRHADEWLKHRTHPTKKQLSSLRVLASALGEAIASDGSGHRLDRGSVPAEVLAALGGDFDAISAAMFAFAHDMAQRAEARTASGPP